jgi:hypothetical protein
LSKCPTSRLRLACQALVNQSLRVITRPQVGLGDREGLLAASMATPLPLGPTAWPQPTVEAEAQAGTEIEVEGDGEEPSATSGDVS